MPIAKQQEKTVIHYFDPFGSTDFNNICSVPILYGESLNRIIFWDQEPFYRYQFDNFIDPFFSKWVNAPSGRKQDHNLKLVTSEYNSEDVLWAQDTYGLETYYYFFHAWAALDWYRGYNRTSIAQKFSERNPYNTFLCPNNIIGGERKHRIEMLQQFVGRNLLDRNLISFPDTCPYEGQRKNCCA